MVPATDKRPLFSVIINNYNYGRYIEEAIESVLNQTFPPDEREVIVVDDGSTDDSREKIKKYQGRILSVCQPNGGQAAALNAGIACAKGALVSFLDADDYWDPMKLQSVSDEFQKSESMDFVYHFMNVVDDEKKIIDRYIFPDPLPEDLSKSQERYLDRYLRGTLPWFSPTSGMTIRSDCLKNAFPVPNEFRISADLYLHYILPFYIRELSLIKKPLGYYRMHGMNLSGGNLLTPEKLEAENKIMLFIRGHIKVHSDNLGYDNSLLLRRVESLIKRYEIMICNLRGMKMKALCQAAMFNEFLPDDTFFYKAGMKATLFLTLVMSSRMHLWLQRRYRGLLNLLQNTQRGV